jgi:twitching motility two-component system response regulator PilG
MRLEFESATTAVPFVDEVSAATPDDFPGLLKKGIAAAKNGEREEARNLLMQATEIDSLNEEVWMWLASISEYPEELVAFLTNVLTINPENERAKKWLAKTESLLTTEVNGMGTAKATSPCPFCEADNDAHAFSCGSCHAALSLSDIEAFFSNSHADRACIYDAVSAMEAEWNLEDLSEAELTTLGVGHLNLRNYDNAQEYLRELLSRDTNNVILSGQLNTIAIRLEDMRRHDELHESKPKGKNVLVVDDSATIRKLISSKLEKSGHNVVCAADGIEGLEKLAECKPDLVFLDITMPRKDGYEVCREIRANAESKDLPVVMISGKDGFFDKVRGKMAGANGYVTKPFGPDTLMKALETHLAAEPAAAEQ